MVKYNKRFQFLKFHLYIILYFSFYVYFIFQFISISMALHLPVFDYFKILIHLFIIDWAILIKSAHWYLLKNHNM